MGRKAVRVPGTRSTPHSWAGPAGLWEGHPAHRPHPLLCHFRPGCAAGLRPPALSLRPALVSGGSWTQQGLCGAVSGVPLVSPRMKASCAPRKAPPRCSERLASSGRSVGVLLLAPLLLLPMSSGRLCALARDGDWSGRGGRPAGRCWEPWWFGQQAPGRVPPRSSGVGVEGVLGGGWGGHLGDGVP